jgi:hypothetical protein
MNRRKAAADEVEPVREKGYSMGTYDTSKVLPRARESERREFREGGGLTEEEKTFSAERSRRCFPRPPSDLSRSPPKPRQRHRSALHFLTGLLVCKYIKEPPCKVLLLLPGGRHFAVRQKAAGGGRADLTVARGQGTTDLPPHQYH